MISTAISLPLPLIAAVGAAIVSSVFLYLFVALKIDVWRLKRDTRKSGEEMQLRCEALENRIVQLNSVVEEAEARAAVLVAPPTSRSGMNLNKRVQAARMAKRGERPEHIAAALGLPRNEVALLLKVQRMTLPN
jgi:hypothetical protein